MVNLINSTVHRDLAVLLGLKPQSIQTFPIGQKVPAVWVSCHRGRAQHMLEAFVQHTLDIVLSAVCCLGSHVPQTLFNRLI